MENKELIFEDLLSKFINQTLTEAIFKDETNELLTEGFFGGVRNTANGIVNNYRLGVKGDSLQKNIMALNKNIQLISNLVAKNKTFKDDIKRYYKEVNQIAKSVNNPQQIAGVQKLTKDVDLALMKVKVLKTVFKYFEKDKSVQKLMQLLAPTGVNKALTGVTPTPVPLSSVVNQTLENNPQAQQALQQQQQGTQTPPTEQNDTNQQQEPVAKPKVRLPNRGTNQQTQQTPPQSTGSKHKELYNHYKEIYDKNMEDAKTSTGHAKQHYLNKAKAAKSAMGQLDKKQLNDKPHVRLGTNGQKPRIRLEENLDNFIENELKKIINEGK